ncbi:MAG TPA: DUF192 domain-containing protein [Thermoanaerobaculia bacterium]|nr:DUF192 domain-containing protein [Thermoanaerobaculia bacterium]
MKTAVVMTLMLFACSKPVTTANGTVPQNTGTTQAPAATSGPRIVMPDGTVFALEVVADEEQRAQGLMFRDYLRPNTGMLFVFPSDGEYSFWMKNTLIPLDMLWIDVNKNVVHVKHDVPPCRVDDCPSYSPGASARYVLELAAGEAKKHNLKAGDKLTFVETDDFVAR